MAIEHRAMVAVTAMSRDGAALCLLCRLNACDAAVVSKLVHTAVRGPGAHDELVPWYQQVPTAGRYRVTVVPTAVLAGTSTVPTVLERETY